MCKGLGMVMLRSTFLVPPVSVSGGHETGREQHLRVLALFFALCFHSLLPCPHGEKQAAGQRVHCLVQVVRYRVTGYFSQGLVRVGTSCLSHGEGWFRIRTRFRFQISTRFKFKIGSRIQSGLKMAHFNSDGPFCPVKEDNGALEALGEGAILPL